MATTNADDRQPLTIDRLERPSRETFVREYERKGRPVIITGVANQWPATRWTAEDLARRAGDRPVRVIFDERGDFHGWYGQGGRNVLQIPFAEFVDKVSGEQGDRRYYLTEYPLRDIAPELLADIDGSRYADTEPALFMGRETHMPCHLHGHTEAILCQLRGDKRVVLVPPTYFSELYPHPWYSSRYQFSRVDPMQPDLDRYPKFAGARPIEFTLRAGEMLYIPVHWWHTTTCPVWNFNATFFWKSKLRRFHFPGPGLQYLAHAALWDIALGPFPGLRKRLAQPGPAE